MVDYYAVVEVEGDGLFGYDLEAFVILAALVEGLLERLELAVLGSGERGATVLHIAYLVLKELDVGQQVVGADTFCRVGIHAVHVGQALEGSFLR